jgi:hypothetical protein
MHVVNFILRHAATSVTSFQQDAVYFIILSVSIHVIFIRFIMHMLEFQYHTKM